MPWFIHVHGGLYAVHNGCQFICTHHHPSAPCSDEPRHLVVLIRFHKHVVIMLATTTSTWDGAPFSWPIWVFSMRSKLSQNQVQATFVSCFRKSCENWRNWRCTCMIQYTWRSDRGYPLCSLWYSCVTIGYQSDPASCSTPQTLGIKERSDASITASEVAPSHTASEVTHSITFLCHLDSDALLGSLTPHFHYLPLLCTHSFSTPLSFFNPWSHLPICVIASKYM